MKYPYIKPTRYVHDSGYRSFETGYCEIEGSNAVNIEVIGRCTDHMWFMVMSDIPGYSSPEDEIRDVNMDLTKNGYIRMFSHSEDKMLAWEGSQDYALSTMRLVMVPIPGGPRVDEKHIEKPPDFEF